nr:hypothetical protein [Minwuia thermotolerans]
MASLAVGPDEDLVQVASPLEVLASRPPLLLSEFRGNDRPEAVPPEPYRLKADLDAPFMQQVFDLAKGKREANAKQDCGPDHRR